MANSKVIYYGKTLIDLTSDTVDKTTLVKGIKAHDKSGTQIIGELELPSGTKTITTNGTHDVKAYASATVNIPIPSYKTEELSMRNVVYKSGFEHLYSYSDAFIYNNRYHYIREDFKKILMYNSEIGKFEEALSGLTLYTYCRACSFNEKVYLIQSSGTYSTVVLYIYNGSSWSSQNLGFTAYMGNGYVSALGVYNNTLYGLFAASYSGTSYNLYRYDGSSAWSLVTTFTGASSSSTSNQIRLFECNGYLNIVQANKHYIFDGTTITQKSTLPMSYPDSVVGLRNEIHAFSYSSEYVYNFTTSAWTLFKTHTYINDIDDTSSIRMYNGVNFNNSLSCIGDSYNYFYDDDGYEDSEVVTFFNRMYWKIHYES